MSHPTPEPVQDQRTDPDPMPQVDLFSHPPKAEVVKRSPGLPGDRVDGRAVPFSGAQSRRVTDDGGARSGAPGTTRRPPR
jgi:hypothetical protein